MNSRKMLQEFWIIPSFTYEIIKKNWAMNEADALNYFKNMYELKEKEK